MCVCVCECERECVCVCVCVCVCGVRVSVSVCLCVCPLNVQTESSRAAISRGFRGLSLPAATKTSNSSLVMCLTHTRPRVSDLGFGF